MSDEPDGSIYQAAEDRELQRQLHLGHYQHLNDMMKFRTNQMESVFSIYIKIFTAIVAGSVWLSLQTGAGAKAADHAGIAVFLVSWLALAACAMLLSHWVSWWRYRQHLSRCGPRTGTGDPVVPPPVFSFRAVELWMLVSIILSAVGYVIWNPLAL